MELILAFLSLFFIGHTSYMTSPDDSEASIEYSSTPQQATYHSETSQKDLPYYFIEPENQLNGILIYMHGAGGGYEQGMSDELFSGNFKNLKQVLKENEFLYVTPETTDFEITGGKELVDLIFELKREHGDLPIYLSGASAGGRTIYYAWQEVEKRNESMGKNFFLNGVIFICPALSEKNVENINFLLNNTKVWIEVGEKDTVIDLNLAKKLQGKLSDIGFKIEFNNIAGGDHSTPVSEIPWKEVLNFIR